MKQRYLFAGLIYCFLSVSLCFAGASQLGVEKKHASLRKNSGYTKNDSTRNIVPPSPSFPDEDEPELLYQSSGSGSGDSYDDLKKPPKPARPPIYYDAELVLAKSSILGQLLQSDAERLYLMRNGQRLSYQPGRLKDLFNQGQNWIDWSYQRFLSWFGIQNVPIRTVPDQQGAKSNPPPPATSGQASDTTTSTTSTETRTTTTTMSSSDDGRDPNRPEENNAFKHSLPADKSDSDDDDDELVTSPELPALFAKPGGMGSFVSPVAGFGGAGTTPGGGIGGLSAFGIGNPPGGIIYQENMVEALESDDEEAQSSLVNDPEVYKVASSDVNPEALINPESGALKYQPLLQLIHHFNYHGVIISYQNIRSLYELYLPPPAIHRRNASLSQSVSYQGACRALEIFRNRQTELAENSSAFNELQRLHQMESLLERQLGFLAESPGAELQADLMDTNILPIALHIIPRIMNQPAVLLALGGGYLGGESVIFYPDLSSRHVNVENAVSQLLALENPLLIVPLQNSMAVIQAGLSDISEPADPELPPPPRRTARENLDELLFQLRMLSMLLPTVQWQSREQLSLMPEISTSETSEVISPDQSGNMLAFPSEYGMATTPGTGPSISLEETKAMENLMVIMAASVSQQEAPGSRRFNNILVMPDKTLETLQILNNIHQLLPEFSHTVRELDLQRLDPDAVNYAQQIQALEKDLDSLVNDLGDWEIVYISQVLLYLKNSPAYSHSEADMANQVVDWVKLAQSLKTLSNLELAEGQEYAGDNLVQITEIQHSESILKKCLEQIEHKGAAGMARFNLQLQRLITMMEQCKESCHYFVKQMAQTLNNRLSPLLSTNIQKYHGVSVQLVDAMIELLAQTPVRKPTTLKSSKLYDESTRKFLSKYSDVIDVFSQQYAQINYRNLAARSSLDQVFHEAGHPLPLTDNEWENICHEINRHAPAMIISKEQKQQLMALPFEDRKKALLHLLGESWNTDHILHAVNRSSEALVAGGQRAITHEELKKTKEGTLLATIAPTETVASDATEILNQQLTLYNQQQELIHPGNMVFNADGDLIFRGLKVYDPNASVSDIARARPLPLKVSAMDYVLFHGKKDDDDSPLNKLLQGKDTTAVQTMFHPEAFHRKVKEEDAGLINPCDYKARK